MSVSMLAVETKGSQPSPQFVSQGHFCIASVLHARPKQTFPRIGNRVLL